VTPPKPKSHTRLVIGGILVTLLLAAVFTMGSLDVPIEPRSWRELMALYAVSCFITAALLIFGLILTRSIVRLWAERSKEQLGARFKTKMFWAPWPSPSFQSSSCFSSAIPAESHPGTLVPPPPRNCLGRNAKAAERFRPEHPPRLHTLGYQAATHLGESPDAFLQHAFRHRPGRVWVFDSKGKLLRGGVTCDDQNEDRSKELCSVSGVPGSPQRVPAQRA